jgi:hypothetical protein
MSKKLTRKQVLALSRALKRRGRKLPKRGFCTILTVENGRGIVASSVGVAGEVCHDIENGKRVYRHYGGFERRHKSERRRLKFGKR